MVTLVAQNLPCSFFGAYPSGCEPLGNDDRFFNPFSEAPWSAWGFWAELAAPALCTAAVLARGVLEGAAALTSPHARTERARGRERHLAEPSIEQATRAR